MKSVNYVPPNTGVIATAGLLHSMFLDTVPVVGNFYTYPGILNAVE